MGNRRTDLEDLSSPPEAAEKRSTQNLGPGASIHREAVADIIGLPAELAKPKEHIKGAEFLEFVQ